MGAKQPQDPLIRLAKAEEKLKNSALLKREVERLSQELQDATKQRDQYYLELSVEKKTSEFLQLAHQDAQIKLAERNKRSRNLSIMSDILFLLGNIFTGWGINYLSSTPLNKTGYVPLTAGILLVAFAIIVSRILASGGNA